jgi:3',5'-cyclic AMP phosphodiesterase CpdA
MKFVHISDLHVGENSTRDALVEKLFNKIIKKYAQLREKPLILITGDFVHDGQADQYQQAEQFMNKLHTAGFQVLMCPGNHDYGQQGLSDDYNARQRYSRFAMQFTTRKSDNDSGFQNVQGGQWNYPIVNKYDDTYFIGLDTMQGVFRLSWWYRVFASFTAAGWLGTPQLDKLDAAINKIKQKSPNSTIVLYMHHHPFYFNFRFRAMQLFDRQRLHQMIGNKVDILLFGHNHVEKRLEDEERKHGIDIIQVFGNCVHDVNVPFYEIDTETKRMQRL